MEIQKEDQPTQEEVIAGAIRRIVDKIKEEDPQELAVYRREIRRHVPLTQRSWFMAWLFRNQLPPAREKKDRFTRLFVSIGKSRRVFAQDLAELFMSQLGIKRPQLGEIKVLDNYSFVEIASGLSKDAITKLSGTEFKGRRIVVNPARKRDDAGPPPGRPSGTRPAEPVPGPSNRVESAQRPAGRGEGRRRPPNRSSRGGGPGRPPGQNDDRHEKRGESAPERPAREENPSP